MFASSLLHAHFPKLKANNTILNCYKLIHMVKRIFIAIVVILLSTGIVSAQKQVVDSLTKELTRNLADTSRALNLMRLAVAYESIDTTKSAHLYKEVIAFGRNKKLTYLSGRIYYNQALLFKASARYADVEKSLDSAMYFYTHSTAPDIQFRKAQVYSERSTLARYSGDYKKASSELLKAIDLYTKLEKNKSLIIAYINLASIYKDMNEYEIEAKYAQKAVNIARKTSKPEDFFITYSNVSLALNMMNEYKRADMYIDSATSYYSDKYMFDRLVTFHLIAGLIDMNLKKMNSAENHFQECYIISEKNSFVYGMIQSRLQLSRVLTIQKKFSEAEPLLLSVYQDAKQTNETSQMLVVLDYLSRFYEESGNYKPALNYYKEFKELTDSVSSIQNKEYMSGLEVKYELATKENLLMSQKAQLLKRRNFAYLLSGFLVTALLIVLFLIINFKHKQKIQQQRINELEKEKQLEAAEAVVKGEEQERTRLAKDLHDGLGGMLSGIKHSFTTMKGNLIMTPDNVQAFERSMDMLDSSIKEMRRVAHNMMPEALIRFGLDTALKDFCNDINQSGALRVNYQSIGLEGVTIEPTTAITLYRIVQELLNNSMKHAQAHSAIVQVTNSNGLLSVTVEDDGKGFDINILKTNKGIGWTNIQNRIDFLKGKLDIRSKEGEGTSVQIELNA